MTGLPFQKVSEVKKQLRDIVKPTLILFIICAVVTLSLSFTNAVTKDKIAQRVRLDEENARKEVLALAESFEELENLDSILRSSPDMGLVKKAFKGLKGGETVGNVFLVESKGYGGTMVITVGIDSEGKVTGVKIGSNNETPGLGSKAKDKPFISQFTGIMPKEPLTVVKSGKTKDEEINAISGATITSNAVVKAVQASIDVNNELKKKGGDS